MSKTKMTKKAVLESNNNVYAVGYCALQKMLRYRKPYAYTAGAYGWNADIYAVGMDAIVTGYRAFGKKVPWELVEKFETVATNILNNKDIDDDYKRALLDGLLEAFLIEVKREESRK